MFFFFPLCFPRLQEAAGHDRLEASTIGTLPVPPAGVSFVLSMYLYLTLEVRSVGGRDLLCETLHSPGAPIGSSCFDCAAHLLLLSRGSRLALELSVHFLVPSMAVNPKWRFLKTKKLVKTDAGTF